MNAEILSDAPHLIMLKVCHAGFKNEVVSSLAHISLLIII